MTKEILLTELRSALRAKIITAQDVQKILLEKSSDHSHEEVQSRIASILYYTGGLVIFLGIAFFIQQQWGTMSSVLRILVTLGFGLSFFVAASVLTIRKISLGISDAFQLIAGLLIPSGIFVTLYELGYRDGSYGKSLIFLTLGILWFLAYYYQRRVVVALFTIIFGSIAYVLFCITFLEQLSTFPTWSPSLYLWLGLGLSYLVLGSVLRERKLQSLAGALYFFAMPIILGTTMTLQGYAPEQRILWELIYPALLFGGLYLSVYLKSRVILVFSSLFLIGYVVKIMYEYFKDTLSGPLLFIFAGMVIMATGYLTIYLNRRYLNSGDEVVKI